jgi:hypothetical protein
MARQQGRGRLEGPPREKKRKEKWVEHKYRLTSLSLSIMNFTTGSLAVA